MSISDHTINAQYEHRIANIVKNFLYEFPTIIRVGITSGDALEDILDDNKEKLANMLLDDIQEWMGFDELLKQVKGE